MDSTFDSFIDNSSKREIVQFIKELLNRSESLHLREPEQKTEGDPYLFQGFDGKSETKIICEICYEYPDVSKINSIISHLNSFFPNKLYVIVLTQVFYDDQQKLKKSFPNYDTTILDIGLLNKRINDFPDLLQKILKTSNIPGTDSGNHISKEQQPDESTNEYRKRQRTGKNPEKYKSKNADSNELFKLRHALSTEAEDKTLIEKGYSCQGLIGYLYSKEKPSSITLYQEYIIEWDDYFYYVDRDKENIKKFETSEKKIIGYLSKGSKYFNFELERYFNEDTKDHFYCVQSNKELLEKLHYKDDSEGKGFFGTFLLSEPDENRKALYVYSTNPDLFLFTPPNIQKKTKEGSINASSKFNKQEILDQIEEHFDSGNKFWWLNTQRNIRQDIRTNSEVARFAEPISLENLPKEISEGEIVVVNFQGNNDIWGLAQFSEYSTDDGFAWFKLKYELADDINVSDLMRIPGFKDAYNSFVPNKLYELQTDLFKEIINTTELSPLDLDDSSQSTKSKINDEVESNISLIPPQISDTDTGTDFLDIKQDVTAFAKIIASNTFNPPLAIALFGKWGTGKSFFMKKLREKIDTLSSQNNTVYQTGISQIHFNAWSYLDSNLWASIVTKIFEGLYEYISGDSKAKKNKAKIEKKLNKELSVLRDERNHLENQKEINKQKIKELENKEKTVQEELTNKIKEVREASLQKIFEKVDSNFKVKEKITSALKKNTNVQASTDEIKKLIPEKYWNDPELALKEAKSVKIFVQEFFTKENIGWNIFVLVLILLAISIIPELLFNLTWLENDFIILPQVILSFLAIITPVWKRFKDTYDKLQPIISSFWEVKKSYDKALESALFTHNQEMESIKIEIDQKKSEVEIIKTQISELNTEIEGLDYRLKNTISTQTLFSFIERRAKGDMYKKHLGIISTIRNDFEVLSQLFNDSQEETKHEEFRKYFKKPLQRIVLYIDDLDRCPEDQVIEVLEAVNLLMAFPLFIVVVGVDPRWVKNALLKKYELQFNTDVNRDEVDKRFETIEVSNYLEKIFQVPFHLNKATDIAVKHMLKEISSTKSNGDYVEKNTKVEPNKDEIIGHPNFIPITGEDEERFLSNRKIYPGLEGSETNLQGIKKRFLQETERQFLKQTENKIQEETEEHLTLTEREVELIQEMSGIIGTNPRAIKRFVNVYHILRAHEGLGPKPRTDEEYLSLMFLLALPMGPYKKLFDKFIFFIDGYHNVGEANVNVFLEKKTKGEDKLVIQLKNEMDRIIKTTNVDQEIQGLDAKTLSDKNKFVQRFTFSKIG